MYIGITLNHLKRHSAQEDFETVVSHSEKQTLKRFSGGSGRPTLILSSSQAHLNCPWCLLSAQVPGPSRNLGREEEEEEEEDASWQRTTEEG